MPPGVSTPGGFVLIKRLASDASMQVIGPYAAVASHSTANCSEYANVTAHFPPGHLCIVADIHSDERYCVAPRKKSALRIN
jgi:hypothetical protein